MGVRVVPLLVLGFVACGEPADDPGGPFTVPVENPAFVNSLPTLDQIEFSVAEDTRLVDRLTATDPEGDPVSFSVATPPVDGEVTLRPDGRLTYTPATNFFGRESFGVVANDGFASTEEIEVAIFVELLRDDPPTVANDIFVLDPGELAEGRLIASDPDLDVLTFWVSDGPSAGQVVLDQSTGEYTYIPDVVEPYIDEFEVTVDDGLFTDTATIHLTYAALQHAPTVLPLTLTTPEDTPVEDTIVAVPAAAATAFFLGAPPSHGLASVDTVTGELVYTPDRDFEGTDAFTVFVVQAGLISPPGFVTVDVTPVNDVPRVLSVGLLTTDEDTPVDGQLTAVDVEGDPLTFAVATPPAHGSVTLDAATGDFEYLPASDYSGSDSFEVVANDGQDDSAPQDVTVLVVPINDAPEFTTGPSSFSTLQDTPVDGQLVATDPEGDPIFYLVETLPTFGNVTLNSSTGEFTYTPAPDYVGSDTFAVVAADGRDSSRTVVTIDVTPAP